MEFHEFLNQLPTRRTDSVARWLRKNRFKIKKNESSSSSSSDATILIDSPEDLPEGITSWEDLAKYRDNQNNNCDDIVFQCRINQRVQLKRLYEVNWEYYNSNHCQHIIFTKACPNHQKEKKSMEFCETRKSCPSCKGTKFNISLRLTIPLKTQPGCDILVALSSSKFRTQPIFNRNKILEMYETSWEFRQHWLEDVKSFVRLNFVSKRLKIFTGRVIRQKNDDQKKRAFLFCNDFEIV